MEEQQQIILKKAEVLENLKNLLARLEKEGFSTLDEDRALAKAICKMEERQNKQTGSEGKYTVVFAYPRSIIADGKLQTCVEFVHAESVNAAKRKACGLRGVTIIAVFKGHRKCLYSEA